MSQVRHVLPPGGGVAARRQGGGRRAAAPAGRQPEPLGVALRRVIFEPGGCTAFRGHSNSNTLTPTRLGEHVLTFQSQKGGVPEERKAPPFLEVLLLLVLVQARIGPARGGSGR